VQRDKLKKQDQATFRQDCARSIRGQSLSLSLTHSSRSTFFLTQTLLPFMIDGASIVNLTGATTRVATAGVAPCAAFKEGLVVLTRYMAKEVAGGYVI
jgi:NAD(P)-dependent dehydrogenase (short-subunit alcohol dehydrogenase family)